MASRTTPPERAVGDTDASPKAQARRPRTRRRGRGSIQSYPTAAGKRWRYQIWVPVDPEQPDLGEKKFSRGGFATAADADAALQDALKQRDQQEKFGGKVPALGVYADAWVEDSSSRTPRSPGTRRSSATTSARSSGTTRSTSSPPPGSPAITATWSSTAGRTSRTRAGRYRPTPSTTLTSCSVRSSTPRSRTGTSPPTPRSGKQRKRRPRARCAPRSPSW